MMTERYKTYLRSDPINPAELTHSIYTIITCLFEWFPSCSSISLVQSNGELIAYCKPHYDEIVLLTNREKTAVRCGGILYGDSVK